jgi:DNA-binding NtrC family response regulator/CHASE2 domain-containing sensor protein
MNRTHAILLVVVAAAAALATVLFPAPFRGVEEQVTGAAYALRGNLQPDTNIVITYIDEPTVRALGWPVPRSYTALMIRTLSDLGVRAIGCEMVFEEERLDYPEYDDLLGRVAGAAGNVVTASYFDRLQTAAGERGEHLPPFTYPGVPAPEANGEGLHLPFQKLRASSAGIGHLNLARERDIPLFVGSPQGTVPAFGMELLRVGMGAERTGLVTVGGEVRLAGRHGTLRFPVAGDGIVRLNFPGNVEAYRAYPFLEILHSYDALRAGREARIPLASLRGKIVVFGIIAQGRSQFLPTPLDRQTPSLALQAAFLDNALQDRFLAATGPVLTFLLSLIFSLGTGITLLLVRGAMRWVLSGAWLLAALLLPFLLFGLLGVYLPLIPLLVPLLLGGTTALSLRHRMTMRQVDVLEGEKKAVLEQLHDREAKVAVLERELVSVHSARNADRTSELLEEIRRYKSEIRTLSSQAEDLEAYTPAEKESTGGAAKYEGIIYSPAGPMAGAVEFLKKISGSDAPVLILGESGTGKELVARAIHRRSPRASGPFIAVNCGALSEHLLESELFGHEKGSFTGATKDRMGRFELAHTGTIFLDEIGEVSESFQVKLLRVLQEGELERVGGTKTIRVDVRVLAATNRDLKAGVAEGRFREDLYYRLNVLSVSLPPLREREEDLPLLVSSFLAGEGMEASKNVIAACAGFPWRGNVRELESAVKHAVLMARAEKRTMITLRDLPEEISASAKEAVAVEEQILEALREKGFSRSAVSGTAGDLGGLNRGTVAEYLRGECLRLFVESSFDRESAVARIALSADPAVLDRVRKRLAEYLENIAGAVDRNRTWEEVRTGLRPKTKNLPQRYHPFLESVAEAYYRRVWDL